VRLDDGINYFLLTHLFKKLKINQSYEVEICDLMDKKCAKVWQFALASW